MKNDVCIKAGSYCPICKGVVLADCRHDSSQFSVPMRYQRMEFNAQLQNEVKKLTIQRDELLAAVEKLARLGNEPHYITKLERQVAALTKERDEAYAQQSKMCHLTADQTRQLAASQAREQQLIELFVKHGHRVGNLKVIRDAVAAPRDDTALQARLKEEREKCAKVCDNVGRDITSWCAQAIRSMT